MPLEHSKSKAAFSHNVKAEMDAGKPQDQALAIAYKEKRSAGANDCAAGLMSGKYVSGAVRSKARKP